MAQGPVAWTYDSPAQAEPRRQQRRQPRKQQRVWLPVGCPSEGFHAPIGEVCLELFRGSRTCLRTLDGEEYKKQAFMDAGGCCTLAHTACGSAAVCQSAVLPRGIVLTPSRTQEVLLLLLLWALQWTCPMAI